MNKYKQHIYQHWQAYFFILGFLFDVFTLGYIDDIFNLGQHALYLVIMGYLISRELNGSIELDVKNRIFANLNKYHEAIYHFIAGSLLSVYTLFFFKSTSSFKSFLVLALIVSLLVLNELPQFTRLGKKIRTSLFVVCLTNYLVALVPILFGNVNNYTFMFAIFISGSLVFILARILQRKLAEDYVSNNLLVPAFITHLLYLFFYFTAIFPPIPLSLQEKGIFRKIEKTDNVYHAYYERPWWKFWQHGDQVFHARPGDQIYFFFSIFSPTQFADTVNVNWYFKTKNGWLKGDTLAVNITGGRRGGYRGYNVKSNYQAGDWRIEVQTKDGREIGSIDLEIIPSQSSAPAELSIQDF